MSGLDMHRYDGGMETDLYREENDKLRSLLFSLESKASFMIDHRERLDAVMAERDDMMRELYAMGASRADLRRATDLSFARIQQILDLSREGQPDG